MVPWLMATQAVIHNGCTTGVEAYAMGVPAISYRAAVNEDYDYGFYRLPNLLSYQCFDFDKLRITLGKILSGKIGPAAGEERKKLADEYLAALHGPLACERIVDICNKMVDRKDKISRPPLHRWLKGYCLANMRTLKRKFKARLPRARNKPEFHRHRYPEVSLEDMGERVSRFKQVLGESGELKVEKVLGQFFRISP